MVAYLPLLVALIGLLIYILSNNGKAQELGRILFFCGVLVLVMSMAGRSVRLP
jgi:hypothetical protein